MHGQRIVNVVVNAETPVVPDPHTLSNIPPGTKWYTVIDLCSAFFSVPLHHDLNYLFAFTYQCEQYTYTRMPRGSCESLSVFNRVLLQHLDIDSTLIQYVDSLLICSSSKELCEKDSVAVLKALAFTKDKLQVSTGSRILGRKLRGEARHIAPLQIETIA